eukprot:6185175-Pleurochrysis_carterae.AAC.1
MEARECASSQTKTREDPARPGEMSRDVARLTWQTVASLYSFRASDAVELDGSVDPLALGVDIRVEKVEVERGLDDACSKRAAATGAERGKGPRVGGGLASGTRVGGARACEETGRSKAAAQCANLCRNQPASPPKRGE